MSSSVGSLRLKEGSMGQKVRIYAPYKKYQYLNLGARLCFFCVMAMPISPAINQEASFKDLRESRGSGP